MGKQPMRFRNKTLIKLGFIGIALCVTAGLSEVPFVFSQQGGFLQSFLGICCGYKANLVFAIGIAAPGLITERRVFCQ
jgi:hypothetical protein